MSESLNRRAFLERSAGTVAALTAADAPSFRRSKSQPKKAVIYYMLPKMPPADQFKLVRDTGFDGVEMPPMADRKVCEEMRTAAEKAGIRLHSVIYGGWGAPLSSPDPAVVEKGIREVTEALDSAKYFGADNILLVPAVVNAQTRYMDAYTRSQKQIRRLIPLAEERKVMICVEEVWNNFLLSPMEFAQYVDSFRSPYVQAYFDVGNVMAFGWPQDWIRTLGKRIRKVHIKDYKGGPGLGLGHKWAHLREGSIDWVEVRRAFADIGYEGYLTTELAAGDEAYLRDLSARLDKVIAGV